MGKASLHCDEKQCYYFKGDACGFEWIEPPDVPPRGSLSRDYCPKYTERVDNDIQVSMSAYN